MTTPEPHPYSVPALPLDLRLTTLGRRVAASDSVASLVASLAFGEPRRTDLALLSSITAARVADMMETR